MGLLTMYPTRRIRYEIVMQVGLVQAMMNYCYLWKYAYLLGQQIRMLIIYKIE